MSSFHSNINVRKLNEISLLLNLDKILTNIKIECPDNISIIKLCNIVDQSNVKELRESIKKYFPNISIEDVNRIYDLAVKLGKEIEIVGRRLNNYETIVNRFDLLSAVTEAVLT